MFKTLLFKFSFHVHFKPASKKALTCLAADRVVLPGASSISFHLQRRMVHTEIRHLKTDDPQPPLIKDVLRVYSMRFCPYAQRVILVLDTKKIKYDLVNVNLQDKPEWIFDKSVGGKVPAIEFDNGDTLYESLVLSDYLDEVYPNPPLYPKDPIAKAKDKILMERFNAVIKSMYKMLLHNGDAMDEVKDGLDLFEKEMASRKTKFLGGETPGMLDLMIWPWCERAEILKIIKGDLYKLPKERFPKILEWQKNMIADEAVKRSYLDPETHTKYFISRSAGSADYDMLVK